MRPPRRDLFTLTDFSCQALCFCPASAGVRLTQSYRDVFCFSATNHFRQKGLQSNDGESGCSNDVVYYLRDA